MTSLSSIVKGGSVLEHRVKMDGYDKPPVQISVHDPAYGGDELTERRDFILRQAIRKAQHIDSEAGKRADALLDNALKKCQIIMKEAESKGYSDGYAKGLASGAKAAENAAASSLEEIRDLAEVIQSERLALLTEQERDLIEMAFLIAQKIIKKEAARDDELIAGMLEDVVRDNGESVKIYLSEYNKSLDLHIDRKLAGKIQSRLRNAKAGLVQREDTIVVDTDSGLTDISIQVQLDQLKEAIGGAQ